MAIIYCFQFTTSILFKRVDSVYVSFRTLFYLFKHRLCQGIINGSQNYCPLSSSSFSAIKTEENWKEIAFTKNSNFMHRFVWQWIVSCWLCLTLVLFLWPLDGEDSPKYLAENFFLLGGSNLKYPGTSQCFLFVFLWFSSFPYNSCIHLIIWFFLCLHTLPCYYEREEEYKRPIVL